MFVLFIVTTVSVDYAKSAPDAMLPLQLTSGSVGSDLFSTINIVMMPFSTSPISVSINMKIPLGHMGLITGRSGLALKNIHAHVGTVDCDFLGDLKVILTNFNSTPYKISCGDRIGQLILLKYSNPCWNKSSTFISEVLNWKNSCDFSKHAGFGSTGQ